MKTNDLRRGNLRKTNYFSRPEFSQVVIDGEEIERIRRAEMVVAEQASRELSEAFTVFAQTLTATITSMFRTIGT